MRNLSSHLHFLPPSLHFLSSKFHSLSIWGIPFSFFCFGRISKISLLQFRLLESLLADCFLKEKSFDSLPQFLFHQDHQAGQDLWTFGSGAGRLRLQPSPRYSLRIQILDSDFYDDELDLFDGLEINPRKQTILQFQWVLFLLFLRGKGVLHLFIFLRSTFLEKLWPLRLINLKVWLMDIAVEEHYVRTRSYCEKYFKWKGQNLLSGVALTYLVK